MINGTTQTAHQKLVRVIESALPGILASAIETETAPLRAQNEALRLTVNKAQDDSNAVGIKAADMVQEKQDLIEGLRSSLGTLRTELETERANHLATAGALTKARNELEALKQPPPPQADLVKA